MPSATLTHPSDVTPTVLQPYQRRLVLAPRRMTWNNWARQAGKSYAFTLRRLE